MIEPTLYGRMYCHLCEDMKDALEPLRRGLSFVLHKMGIDSDPALETRFDESMPVPMTGAPETSPENARELCHYFLDIRVVQAWFTARNAHS